MSLQKSVVPVQFSGGQDTKTAKQLVLPGKFLLLRNCVRIQGDKVDKRAGFSKLSTETLSPYQSVTSSGPVSTSGLQYGTALARFKNELLMLDSQNFQVFSYSRGANNWISRQESSDQGTMSLLTTGHVESSSIIRNSATQAMPDLCTIGTRSMLVWEDSRGGCGYSIFDNTTNEVIIGDQQSTATGSRPKCLGIGNNFIIMYYDSGSLKQRIVPITALDTLGTETTILNGTMTDNPWDWENYSTYSFFAVNNDVGGLTLGYINLNGDLGDPVQNGLPAPISTANPADRVLTVNVDVDNGRVFVLYQDGGDANLRIISSDDAFFTPHDDLVANIGNVTNITLFPPRNSGSTSMLRFEYETFLDLTSGGHRNRIWLGEIQWTGVGPATNTLYSADHNKEGVGLVVKGINADLHSFTVGAFDSSLQSTYFIYGPGFHNDGDASTICARIAPGVGNGYTKDPDEMLKPGLPKANVLSDGTIMFPVQIKNSLRAVGTTVTSDNVGIEIVRFTFPTPYYSVDTLGDNAHIAGSVLLHYDGTRVFEDNFHVFPEDINESVGSGSSTFPATGNYSYQFTYEWTDGKGQIHRSAPSVLITATLAATTDLVNLEIPTIRTFTNSNRDIKIVIYRSAPNLSTVLYKLASISNDLSVNFVTYTDTNSNGGGLTSREILYTVGGILENIPAPACKVVHKHGNRLFVTGLEDPTLIEYSREWVPQEPVQFNDTLTIRTDELGGSVTTLSTLDDKLIVFKRDRVFTVSGQGPTDSGEQNDFTAPQLISADVGTQEPLSVVITPLGLMFKSLKGIYLLTRSLETRYIGAGVEAYNDLSITSANVLTSKNEVRFTTSDGDCLVYNYFFDQWSTFSNYEAMSAVLDIDDTYLHLKANGTTNRELAGTYNDNGARFSMDIETSWFSFNSIQGFQRVYRISLLGDFLSHHFTQLDIAYNFQDVYNQTVYFDTRSGLSSGTYGDDIYGDESPYGGLGNQVYQWRLKPQRQKCEAMKLRIKDIDSLVPGGGGSFSLVHLAFEVGAKTGVNRQRATKSL